MRLTEGYGELCFLNPPAMPVYKVVEPSEFAPPAQLPDKDEVSSEDIVYYAATNTCRRVGSGNPSLGTRAGKTRKYKH